MSDGDFVPALRFPALTRFYDPVIAATTRETVFKQLLTEQAAPSAGERILDLGCGTGTLALLIKRTEPEAELHGLDADPVILARARVKAEESGLQIGLEEGLSDRLPYADASFDQVVSTLFFHHLAPDVKARTAAEIRRILRPGGRLHVADWGRPSDPLMGALSLSIRLLDGFGPTRDNLNGRLPAIFARAGLAGAEQTRRLRTVYGTMAFYRAQRPPTPA